MSQLSAFAANHKRLKRLPYSIMTVPKPGWMPHNVRVVVTVLNLSFTNFSTSAAGTPGGAVGAAVGAVVGTAVGAVVGTAVGGGALVGTAVGAAVGAEGVGAAQAARITASRVSSGTSLRNMLTSS